MEVAEIVDSNGPCGLNEIALRQAIAQEGSLPKALYYLAHLVDVGDGGVDNEHCIVPMVRDFALWLEQGLITDQAFYDMAQLEP